MKKLTEDQQALKDLIENTEEIYTNFRLAFRREIPRKPEGVNDSRIHRIEGLWHEMRKEIDDIQTKFVQSEIEGCESAAFTETFRYLMERR